MTSFELDDFEGPNFASEIARDLARGFSQQYTDWVIDGGVARATLEQVENPGAYFGALRQLEIDPVDFHTTLEQIS